MNMDSSHAAGDSPRDRLIAAILEFVAGQDLLTLEDIRTALEREIDAAGPDALVALKERLSADIGWSFYPRDPLAQRIHHVLSSRFLHRESHLQGVDHLVELLHAPLVVVSNHLSYADANAVEVLMQRHGAAAIANRLTAIAGPKVFTSRQRRFSSLCFGTIKVPQSADVSSGEAVLSAREVARAARRAIEIAHERLRAGDALLLFGEGTRSRTGAMQPMLAGAARYIHGSGARVLPVGLVGSEELFPIGEHSIRPARIVVRVGSPIGAEALVAAARGDRRLMMDAVGLAVAELLPDAYRGVYGSIGKFADAARALQEARSASAIE